jgi:hypothetical protein
MKTIEVLANVDAQRTLRAELPVEVPPGQVRVIVVLPEKDEAGDHWASGIAREWADELADPREDIYTWDDGQPADAPR